MPRLIEEIEDVNYKKAAQNNASVDLGLLIISDTPNLVEFRWNSAALRRNTERRAPYHFPFLPHIPDPLPVTFLVLCTSLPEESADLELVITWYRVPLSTEL